jgi:hypothetical protein
VDDGDEKGKAGYFINPLQFARIERATRLLIVNVCQKGRASVRAQRRFM